MKTHKFISSLLLPLALLVGCGGGGGSSTSGTSTANSIKVVPALGAFGAGANVTFIRPDGSQIAAAQTDATGAAFLNMGSYTGPFISKVTGGPGVTFYNENTFGRDSFTANDTLLAVVPSVPKSVAGEAPSLGVTPLTNAAASVLIANPSSPSIDGTVAATIASQISVANATVAVAAGLPAGVDMLSAPQALSSRTDKISSSNPAAVVYGAYLASLAQAAPTASILNSVKAMAADARANNGTFPATSKTIIDAGKNLAKVVADNVATSSQTASVTSFTTAFNADPILSLPASRAAVTAIAVTNNGGVAPTTPVVVALPPVVVLPPLVAPPVVVTPPAVVTPTATCSAPTFSSSSSGTFTLYINGVAYTGSITGGVLYANNAGLNALGSGSGVVTGSTGASAGGNDGYVLSSGLTLISGSASGTAVINNTTYNITSNASTKAVQFVCP
jgi:hypothetical protein